MQVLILALGVIAAAAILILERLLWRRVLRTSFGTKYGKVIRVAAVVVVVLIVLLTFLRKM